MAVVSFLDKKSDSCFPVTEKLIIVFQSLIMQKE